MGWLPCRMEGAAAVAPVRLLPGQQALQGWGRRVLVDGFVFNQVRLEVVLGCLVLNARLVHVCWQQALSGQGKRV